MSVGISLNNLQVEFKFQLEKRKQRKKATLSWNNAHKITASFYITKIMFFFLPITSFILSYTYLSYHPSKIGLKLYSSTVEFEIFGLLQMVHVENLLD